MSGRVLSAAPRMGLFGKLPAHGDFVRRGDPDLVRRLDDWLTDAVELYAATAGEDLDAHLSALPTWCFRLSDGTAGALAASQDKVGRIYPLIAGTDAPTAKAADVAALLVEARDQGMDADAASARLVALPGEEAPSEAEGWWRAGMAMEAIVPGELPTGEAFARLFAAEG